jgi:hypothetical protein
VVSKASVPDGTIVTYGLTITGDANPAQHWHFDIVGFSTGKLINSIEVGQGVSFDNHYSAIMLHPDAGDALIPVYGGTVRVRSQGLS